MNELDDHVAIVTGAANGIGRGIARSLSAAGCRLALVDIDEPGLKSLWQELAGRSSTISIHAVDIAEERAVKVLIDDVVRTHNRISILINNAAISMIAPFEETNFRNYERLMATNFWAAIYLCRYSLPFLREERDARIVNVLSSFALLGFPNKAAYCSSKAALLGFSNALYTELHGTSVRVSVAIPPPVDTNLIRHALAYDQSKKHREVEFVARHGMPVERVAQKIIKDMMRGSYRIRIGPRAQMIDTLCRWFPTLTHTLLARNRTRIDFV